MTIISPNFNKGKAVVECLESVQRQTWPNWEFILIDDGSTDGSFELARKAFAGDTRFRFLENKTVTKGANAARNRGIEEARADFVMFLDSDDLIVANSLEMRLKDFESFPEKDLLIYPMGIFYQEVGDSDLIINIPNSEPYLHRFLNRDITWLISGPIWKKKVLQELNGFDLSLHSQQDYDLHIRALIAGYDFKYFHQPPDTYYRRNIESVPRLTSQSAEHFEQRYKMVLHHHGLLKAAGKLGNTEKMLLANYLLDIAQMMRWHKTSLGKSAKQRARAIWTKAFEIDLISKNHYAMGLRYIDFKHQMLYNRFPKWQAKKEKYYRVQLGNLIFNPSKTYSRVTLADYEG